MEFDLELGSANVKATDAFIGWYVTKDAGGQIEFCGELSP
jgi:hypothetical protein